MGTRHVWFPTTLPSALPPDGRQNLTTLQPAKAAACLIRHKCYASRCQNIFDAPSHVVSGNIRRETRLTTKQAAARAAALNQTRFGLETCAEPHAANEDFLTV